MENSSANENVDEIKQFRDARYISASESCWRIFGFSLHSQYPNTVRLHVHLEGQQNIRFNDKDKLSEVLKENNHTPLTRYFDLCNNG